jgi:hypothetical protein
MRHENLSLYRRSPPLCSSSAPCHYHRSAFRPTVPCEVGFASREHLLPRRQSRRTMYPGRGRSSPGARPAGARRGQSLQGYPQRVIGVTRGRPRHESQVARSRSRRERSAPMPVKTLDVSSDVGKILSYSTEWTTGRYPLDSADHDTDGRDEIAVNLCGQGAVCASGSASGTGALRRVRRDDASGSGSDSWRTLPYSLDIVAVRSSFDGLLDTNDDGGRAEMLPVLDSVIADCDARGDTCHNPFRPAVTPRAAGGPGSPSSRRAPSDGSGRAARRLR